MRDMEILKKIGKFIRKFIKDQKGSSMIESGLLIALSLILFLMLIALVTDVYGWIETKFTEIVNFFEPSE